MEKLECQQLPLSPPEAFLRWADRELLGNAHARLYRHARYYDPLTERLVTGVEVTCSACGEAVYLGKVPAGGCHQAYPSAPFGFMDINGQSVIHGSHSLCPHCGAQTTAVHIASFRDESIIASCHPLEITAIEGHLVLICWYISRRLNKIGREYLAPVTPGTSDNITASPTKYEIRATSAPCVYVEVGFHDNPTEAQWIIDNTDKIAEMIARGLCEYYKVTYKEDNKMFEDVKQDKWYAADVAYCAEHGLMHGDGNGKFRPEDGVTRAELAAVARRLHQALTE